MNPKGVKEIFTDCLSKKGLRNTQQRDRIINAFLSAERHITAEDLHNMIKKKYPEIGFATVHRNLKLMCECGIAEEIKIGTQKARYEQKYGHKHHDHLICTKCGRFTEVNDERIEKLQEKLAEAHEFQPLRHKLEIYGVCSRCK